MPLPSPKFEDGAVWDGTTPHSRPSKDVYKGPDGEIGNRHSAEIIALEELLKDVIEAIELLENPGAANSLLGVKSDQSGLEYKVLIEGSGITITHAPESITITAGAITPLTAEADSTTKIGNVIYLKSNSHLELAKADGASTVQVAGVAISNTAPTASCSYITEGQVERADWTDIAGVVSLTPGATYFLSATATGKITTVAPTTGGQYVVRVGRAVSTTELDVEIELPVLL